MSLADKEKLPQITIKESATIFESGQQRVDCFLINHQHNQVPLYPFQFKAIEVLGKKPNSLVYTRDLAKHRRPSLRQNSDDVSAEQYVAEMMYKLSQPDFLKDLLQPEIYGPYIVGYRLAAIVNIEKESHYRTPPSVKKPFWDKVLGR